MLNTSNDPHLEEALIRSNIAKDIPDLSKKNKIMLFIAISLVLLLAFALLLYIFSQRNDQSQEQSLKLVETAPTQSNNNNLNSNPMRYINNIARFTFVYPDYLGIQWSGVSEDPSDSSLIYVSPIENMGFEGMTVQISVPGVAGTYATQRELVRKGIIDYHASSIASYRYPENNQILEINTGTGGYVYVYEIAWSEDGKSGTDVIRVYPLESEQYPLTIEANQKGLPFLFIKYSKDNKLIYDPIVGTLVFIPTENKYVDIPIFGYVYEISDNHLAEIESELANYYGRYYVGGYNIWEQKKSGKMLAISDPSTETFGHFLFHDASGVHAQILASIDPGTCVELYANASNTIIPMSSTNLSNSLNFLSIVSVKKMDTLDCYSVYDINPLRHWSNNNDTGNNPLVEISSKIYSHKRPSFDIYYDYAIKITSATAQTYGYIDTRGVPTTEDEIFEVVILPSSVDMQKKFNLLEKSGKQVTLAGSFEWGYPESMVFRVTEIRE